MSEPARYYVETRRGVAEVVTTKPDKPAAIAFRTREHALYYAEKWNDDNNVSTDGEESGK